MLFHNRGDGTFEEIAAYAGVTATGWSWQPVFLDVDLDGYEDIIIPTGYYRDVNDLDAIEKGKYCGGPASWLRRSWVPMASRCRGQPRNKRPKSYINRTSCPSR